MKKKSNIIKRKALTKQERLHKAIRTGLKHTTKPRVSLLTRVTSTLRKLIYG